MADPFSVVAGAAGLIDLAIKLTNFIRKTRQGSGAIDDDLQQLGIDIEELKEAGELIWKAFDEDVGDGDGARKDIDAATANIWSAASSALTNGRTTLMEIESLIELVKGEEGSSKFDRVRRHFRKLSQDDEFLRLRKRLDKNRHILQMSLIALNMHVSLSVWLESVLIRSSLVTRQSQAGHSQSVAGLSEKMSAWEAKLDSMIHVIEGNVRGTMQESDEENGIAAAKAVRKLAWLNVHFMMPQSVNNLYVGRKLELVAMKQAVDGYKKGRGTKRVVIYGLNGSGKTQFCCKFAQDNRPSFWGVFFIDATSSMTVKSSHAVIAEQVGIEKNESNVRHWLSVQTKPWLLLVDNADENLKSHSPEDFIPESESGVVVFTTRNHVLRTLATLPLKFEGLEEEEASTLLLTSADRPRPYSPILHQAAKHICSKFGHLPLAILHAGKAILRGTCKLENCLDVLEHTLAHVKSVIEAEKARTHGSLDSQSTQVSEGPARKSFENVYATFELVVPAVTEDGLQMLRLLSFMQSQHFHYQILWKAIVNPQRQSLTDKKSPKDNLGAAPSRTWDRILRDSIRKLHGTFVQLGERTALPRILHRLQDADPADVEYALRELLSQLRELALLDYNEQEDTYSMHSSVQWWIRASMTFQEKQVWCQAASNVLALGILLPPEGVRDGDADLRRRAGPHIEYVRMHEKQLMDDLLRKQKKRMWYWSWTSWLSADQAFTRSRILQNAKFSLAYAECGMWRESRELMLGVDRYLVRAIGLDDPVSIKVRLFLSAAYWWLGEPDESLRLQEELLTSCERSLGEEHVDTLNVKDRVATSLWQQGEFHKARRFAQQSVDGLRKAYPTGHVDRSRALTTLGRCLSKLAAFDEAVELNLEALRGLESAEEESGDKADHDNAAASRLDKRTLFGEQTLDAMEVLAMARHDRHRYGHTHPEDLSEAHRLQAIVLDQQNKQLGIEHPKSLWAVCNLARIKASMGESAEAETMLKIGLPIAERTIGADHIGTLMGKAYLGQVLLLENKLDEAEIALSSVMKAHRARGGEKWHPDRLVAATLQLDCYRRRKDHEMIAQMEKDVLEGIRRLFGPDSPWEYYVVEKYSSRTEANASHDEDELSATNFLDGCPREDATGGAIVDSSASPSEKNPAFLG